MQMSCHQGELDHLIVTSAVLQTAIKWQRPISLLSIVNVLLRVLPTPQSTGEWNQTEKEIDQLIYQLDLMCYSVDNISLPPLFALNETGAFEFAMALE